ncbi:uncharacterized protein C8A04DRAFT_36090 [Dichotomopilus funicola]|uniref:Gamma-butyrobetaine dioxygenase n=1 Tax=Dichotomopilus funicola TaxID=1934379 RepID=A0AAN6V5J1_9PEZI|nr:hypothetical protein C8A04DRAFT_36090 [Dichotomopilus funicola]
MASRVSGSYRAGLLAMRLPAARLTASVPASQTAIRRLAGLQSSIPTTCTLNYAPRREYYTPPWRAGQKPPWKSHGADTQPWKEGPGGQRHKPLISTLWLRDSCPCPLCVDPDSGQKNFSTTSLPENPEIETAQLDNDGSLRVVWANDPLSGGAQHISVYPVATVEYLKKWDRAPMYRHSPGARLLWDRPMFEGLLDQGRGKVDYQDWMAGGDQFWRALNDLREMGLIFVRGVPSDEEAVERIAKQIGPIMETFYGRTWDVRSKPNAENVAYTSQFLGLHQDLLYYPDVPHLQLLHCLSNDAEGGESLFSNGARAAVELHLATPWSRTTLKTHPVTHGYNKNGHDYTRTSPTILLSPDASQAETRWSPPFQQPFRPPQKAEHVRNFIRWKRAAARFQELAESNTHMFETKLQEGECVIFNNRYILHGRRAFATGNQGGRWLKGTYVNEYEYNRAMLRLDQHMRPKAIPGAWPKQGTDWRKFQRREREIVRVSMDRAS